MSPIFVTYFRIRRQWLNGRGAQAPAALEPQRFTKMDQGVVQQYRGVLSERDDIKGNKNSGQHNVKSPMGNIPSFFRPQGVRRSDATTLRSGAENIVGL